MTEKWADLAASIASYSVRIHPMYARYVPDRAL